MAAASRRLAAPSLAITLATWKEAVRGLMNRRPARGQHLERRAGGEQPGDERRGGDQEVLAVVE
jgi:hypothetical protein